MDAKEAGYTVHCTDLGGRVDESPGANSSRSYRWALVPTYSLESADPTDHVKSPPWYVPQVPVTPPFITHGLV